jgi:hypothetical protein
VNTVKNVVPCITTEASRVKWLLGYEDMLVAHLHLFDETGRGSIERNCPIFFQRRICRDHGQVGHDSIEVSLGPVC